MYVMIKTNIGQFCAANGHYCGWLDLIIPIARWAMALKLKCTPWVYTG